MFSGKSLKLLCVLLSYGPDLHSLLFVFQFLLLPVVSPAHLVEGIMLISSRLVLLSAQHLLCSLVQQKYRTDLASLLFLLTLRCLLTPCARRKNKIYIADPPSSQWEQNIRICSQKFMLLGELHNIKMDTFV